MTRKANVITLLVISVILIVASVPAIAGEVHSIRIDGVINPVSSQFIIKAVDRAENEKAEALIIELDTPGGLLEATREIVQRFLAAEVPVIVYVSPSGARAGSAGVFITMAAHIAVMAPGTNIGAAHPVTVGGGGMPGAEKDTSGQSVMGEKMTNDAVAMIRAIAEERERNVEWAEESVRNSASITDKEALKRNVIDLIAEDTHALLTSIDGRTVKLSKSEKVLDTEHVSIQYFEMSWRERLFDYITNPNIAYILMMVGIYGIIFELSSPGSILPGTVGGICLVLAFFAFQTLPINIAGVLLILFGIMLLLLEIKVVSYGGLTIGGAIALFLGSIMLIETDIPELQISLGVIIPAVIGTVVFALFAVALGVKAQSRKVTTGQEGLIGKTGKALEDLDPRGAILVEGEYWIVVSASHVKKGNLVKVLRVKGMKLFVEPTISSEESI